MAARILKLAALVALIGFTSSRLIAEPKAGEVHLGPDLEVRRLRPGYWLHVSRDAQGIPANGMLVRTTRGVVLVDTGWSADQTERLLAWSRRALAVPCARRSSPTRTTIGREDWPRWPGTAS